MDFYLNAYGWWYIIEGDSKCISRQGICNRINAWCSRPKSIWNTLQQSGEYLWQLVSGCFDWNCSIVLLDDGGMHHQFFLMLGTARIWWDWIIWFVLAVFSDSCPIINVYVKTNTRFGMPRIFCIFEGITWCTCACAWGNSAQGVHDPQQSCTCAWVNSCPHELTQAH